MIYAYLPALGFIVYLLILLVPFWWLSDWRDLLEARETRAGLGLQIAGFVVFGSSVLPLLIRSLTNNEFIMLTTTRGIFMALFFLLILVSNVVGGEPSVRVTIYALLTWSVVILAASFWCIDYATLKRALGLGGMLVLGFLIVLLVKHGVSNPGTAKRAIGGISAQPVRSSGPRRSRSRILLVTVVYLSRPRRRRHLDASRFVAEPTFRDHSISA